jgi:CheY-like chemotaxis protein
MLFCHDGRLFMAILTSSAARFQTADKLPPEPRRETRSIFLFQDNSPFAAVVKAALDQAGYTVIHADTLEAALRLWAKSIMPVDLFLADRSLQRDPGLQRLTQLLQAENPHMRVLFVNNLERPGTTPELLPYPQHVLDSVKRSLDASSPRLTAIGV